MATGYITMGCFHSFPTGKTRKHLICAKISVKILRQQSFFFALKTGMGLSFAINKIFFS